MLSNHVDYQHLTRPPERSSISVISYKLPHIIAVCEATTVCCSKLPMQTLDLRRSNSSLMSTLRLFRYLEMVPENIFSGSGSELMAGILKILMAIFDSSGKHIPSTLLWTGPPIISRVMAGKYHWTLAPVDVNQAHPSTWHCRIR